MLIYNLDYTPKAEDGIKKLKKEGNQSALKKLDILLKELEEHPRTGTGHPERLKGFPERERWSRRITEKHRLVYDIEEEVVVVLIVSAYGHYADK